MNNFEANYKKILEVLRVITKKENFLTQIRKPKLTDIELIAMNLTAEYLSIDSECQLFRVIPDNLKAKIERSVFNRRKRKLFSFFILKANGSFFNPKNSYKKSKIGCKILIFMVLKYKTTILKTPNFEP